MGSGNEPGNDELKEQALEMMEQSLAILYALQEPAAADLHDVIERVMGVDRRGKRTPLAG